MLYKNQIKYVVDSAMSKYAAENDGKKGLDKRDVIPLVMMLGGDQGDIRSAMLEDIHRIAGGMNIWVR